MTVLATILILSGAFFLTVSCIGLIRLPDFYTRTHAVGKSETLGAMLVLAGLAVYNGFEVSTLKILIILVFLVIASPTATHAILRAARCSGLEPWTRKKKQTSDSDETDETPRRDIREENSPEAGSKEL
ncbi:monovalent cation/H(+) antiporter subunit G [Chloroflexota bacterium]